MSHYLRIGAFVLLVVAAAIGAREIEAQTNQKLYENQVAGCERANTTTREPLRAFLDAFAADESEEHDDRELLRVTRQIRDSFKPVDCEAVVERP